MDLSRTQVFYIYKVAKIVMICKNKDFVFAIF